MDANTTEQADLNQMSDDEVLGLINGFEERAEEAGVNLSKAGDFPIDWKPEQEEEKEREEAEPEIEDSEEVDDNEKDIAESDVDESGSDEESSETPETDESDTDIPVDDPRIKEYENLKSLFGKQANELGQARAALSKVNPLLQYLDDPNFQQHVLKYDPQNPATQPQPPPVDPYDPESIQKNIDFQVDQKLRATMAAATRQQRQRAAQAKQNAVLNTFNANLEQTKTALKAKGFDDAQVQQVMQPVIQKIFTGDIADIVNTMANHNNEVAAAEKRGREAAMKKLKAAENNPKRAASSGKRPAKKMTVKDITSAREAMEYMNRVEPGSKEDKELGTYLHRMAGVE